MNYLKKLFKINIDSNYNNNYQNNLNNQSLFTKSLKVSVPENYEYTSSRLHTRTKKTKLQEPQHSFNENYPIFTSNYLLNVYGKSKVKKQENMKKSSFNSTEMYISEYVFDTDKTDKTNA